MFGLMQLIWNYLHKPFKDTKMILYFEFFKNCESQVLLKSKFFTKNVKVFKVYDESFLYCFFIVLFLLSVYCIYFIIFI